VPVPGCPTVYLGPGGLHDGGKYENCTGGIAGYIDTKVITPDHMYHGQTCREIYNCNPYEAEGLVGSLTSIFLCWLGLQSGRILVYYQDHKNRMLRWLIWGVFFVALALLLCQGKRDDGWIPINKNLWSPTFSFAMGGTGFLFLLLFYFFIDVYPIWNGSPFSYVGMNSILIYCGHELLGDYFPFSYHTDDTHTAQLFRNLIGVACWVVIAFRMYQNKFFINI